MAVMSAPDAKPREMGPGRESEVIGSEALRQSRRGLTVPFGLRLSGAGPGEILACSAILRHLPGKRLVCRATRPNGEHVIVKLFLAPRHARRHCKRERAGIAALVKAQVPTPALLRHATLDDGRTPVVVTAAIAQACSLADCWPGLGMPERRNHLRRCIEMIARLHTVGLVQRDIHPGNFLVSGNDIFMIDGDAVRELKRRPLGNERRALANLAHFLVQFDPEADRWVQAALVDYEQHRGWQARPRRLGVLRRLVRDCRHQRMRQRAAKVTRKCTDVVVRRSWRRYTAWDRRWYATAMQPLLDDPDRFMDAGDRIKDGNSATVVKIRYQDQTLVIKRYNIKNLPHFLRRCLRPSRGRAAWRNAFMLRMIGIETPSPLALIEDRWGAFGSRAFLICAHQPGTHLADYWPPDWQADDTRMDALVPLTTLIGRLYAARISHGDLKATNLIVDRGKVVLMDLDGLRIHRTRERFSRHYRKDCERLLRNWPRNAPIRRALRQALQGCPVSDNR